MWRALGRALGAGFGGGVAVLTNSHASITAHGQEKGPLDDDVLAIANAAIAAADPAICVRKWVRPIFNSAKLPTGKILVGEGMVGGACPTALGCFFQSSDGNVAESYEKSPRCACAHEFDLTHFSKIAIVGAGR